MGVAALGQCYEGADQALGVVCGTAYPAQLQSGAVVSCVGTDSASGALLLERAEPGASAVAYSLATTLPPCDVATPYADVTGAWMLGLAALAPIWFLTEAWRRSVGNQ